MLLTLVHINASDELLQHIADIGVAIGALIGFLAPEIKAGHREPGRGE
jgi:hypothetical protein